MLKWMQDWYCSRCDGEWEHGNGIVIDTIDNPGWSVLADADGMVEEGRSLVVERSSNDWVHCEMRDGKFYGFGGPENLVEILSIFRAWVNGSSPQVEC